MFEIEKNVEMPPKQRAPRRSKYPFAEMDVGDSFLVPALEANERRRVQVSIVGAWHYQKRRGNFPSGMITTRTVKGGVRCWRVA